MLELKKNTLQTLECSTLAHHNYMDLNPNQNSQEISSNATPNKHRIKPCTSDVQILFTMPKKISNLIIQSWKDHSHKNKIPNLIIQSWNNHAPQTCTNPHAYNVISRFTNYAHKAMIKQGMLTLILPLGGVVSMNCKGGSG